jgi:type III secretory pathway component EscS
MWFVWLVLVWSVSALATGALVGTIIKEMYGEESEWNQ